MEFDSRSRLRCQLHAGYYGQIYSSTFFQSLRQSIDPIMICDGDLMISKSFCSIHDLRRRSLSIRKFRMNMKIYPNTYSSYKIPLYSSPSATSSAALSPLIFLIMARANPMAYAGPFPVITLPSSTTPLSIYEAMFSSFCIPG